MKTSAVMSMVNPSTDTLLSKVDSRYGLVVLAARRARQLLDGAQLHAESQSTKDVTNALEEIAEGKISYSLIQETDEEEEVLPEEGEAISEATAEVEG
ncbi:MAG: DNA-directed RNA polymerase subunit omega [Selenomonadaceae bacterium]|nr:DNA-directed RNA polymerase subunit omega [Selenomonadaceae bacterium]